jgi:hypothetical protein
MVYVGVWSATPGELGGAFTIPRVMFGDSDGCLCYLHEGGE